MLTRPLRVTATLLAAALASAHVPTLTQPQPMRMGR
jgi:hypothetical protein